MSAALPGYTKNKLLSGLPTYHFERLLPHLEPVKLQCDEVLFKSRERIKHALFPMSGLVSLLGTTRNVATNKVGLAIVGSEGMIGVPLVLRNGVMPYEVVVRIPGEALRINAEVLKNEMRESPEFEDRLLKYSNTLLDHMGQSLICKQFHSIEARFCCGLLDSRDRVGSDTLDLTQEILSNLLGAPRTGVTKVANDLRDAGLIQYRRGKIKVSNREGIERRACECYTICKLELNHLSVSA